MAEHDSTAEHDNTQDEPIQAGSTEASGPARLQGLLDQVRSDLQTGSASDAPSELRRRLSEAGFMVDDRAFERLLAEISQPQGRSADEANDPIRGGSPGS